jgi:hypothetical protein
VASPEQATRQIVVSVSEGTEISAERVKRQMPTSDRRMLCCWFSECYRTNNEGQCAASTAWRISPCQDILPVPHSKSSHEQTAGDEAGCKIGRASLVRVDDEGCAMLDLQTWRTSVCCGSRNGGVFRWGEGVRCRLFVLFVFLLQHYRLDKMTAGTQPQLRNMMV